MAKLYPQLVLLGDSLIQQAAEPKAPNNFCFQSAVHSHLNRCFDVVNRGFSGYNTSQTLAALPQMFSPSGAGVACIDFLVVLLGANDAALTMPTDNQSVPIDQYRENLKAIVTHDVFASHRPKVLIVTPPPLDEIKVKVFDMASGSPYAMRQSARSAAYSQVAREVAAETEGAVLIDLWKAIMERAVEMCDGRKDEGINGPPYLGDPECGLQGGLDSLLPDGLHMNGVAYEIFAKLVLEHVKPEYAGDLAGEQDYVFPEWRVAPWLEKDKGS